MPDSRVLQPQLTLYSRLLPQGQAFCLLNFFSGALPNPTPARTATCRRPRAGPQAAGWGSAADARLCHIPCREGIPCLQALLLLPVAPAMATGIACMLATMGALGPSQARRRTALRTEPIL